MASTPLLTVAFLLGLHWPYDAVETKVYGLHHWRLTVRTDRFTRVVSCQIADNPVDPRVTVEGAAWDFHFGPDQDTSKAWFGVNDAQPLPISDVQSQLVRSGDLVGEERLEGAAPGIVRIPTAAIGQARRVSIQVAPRVRPVTFNVGDGARLLASARGLKCPL